MLGHLRVITQSIKYISFINGIHSRYLILPTMDNGFSTIKTLMTSVDNTTFVTKLRVDVIAMDNCYHQSSESSGESFISNLKKYCKVLE